MTMLNCILKPHQHLIASLEKGVLTLAIDRPSAKNALYKELYLWIAQAIDEADASDDVRVIILRGAEQDFTAGNDMRDFLASIDKPLEGLAGDEPPFVLLKAVARFSKPFIVAVKGVAIGIGVTLLLHADLAYADESAIFQLPFVSLGLSPEGAAGKLMVEQMGYHRAAELLLTADKFDAATAEKYGLVNQVFAEDNTRAPYHLMALGDKNVYGYAETTAQKLAQLPIASLKLSKSLMKKDLNSILEHIDIEAEIFMQRVQSPELREAVQAFLEKRTPDFSQFN
ncbi:enoyl-CoA hydratase/isomerase family protein [Acinetobacter sp. MD2]|nr:enoyl-CoA hydratase-related protein [Acinetobacter sp. MD2]MEB3766277.1 enoyl-CoA hydratase/isomerase family protein [Acinetobacter sp. MD2]